MPATGAARVRLELSAEVEPDLRLVVVNAGDEPAREVVPELLHQHRTLSGESVALQPGARHEWRLPLPPLPGPGTFPVTIRVRWTGAGGDTGSVPIVALVSMPGQQPSPVRASLEAAPVARSGNLKLRLDNPAARPLAGRAVLVLPAGLSTEPESVPAGLPAAGDILVPFVVENHGLPAGTYPVYAIFEYTQDGVQRTALARASVGVVTGAGVGWMRRLVVGLSALAFVLALFAIAWRTGRPRRPESGS